MRCVLLKFPQEECDLHCSYCYLGFRHRHGTAGFLERHTPEAIAEALSPNRLGGACFFYGYADGEPLLHGVNAKILGALAARGHFVAVTTNLNSEGILRLEKEVPVRARWRVLVLASLHYHELLRAKRLDRFFENMAGLRHAGFSGRIRLCLAPEYLAALQDIDALCKRHTGQLPLLTRWRGKDAGGIGMAALDRIGARSPVYCLQKRCADEKRKEFCLAGERSAVLELGSGQVRACLAEPVCGKLDPANPGASWQFPGKPVGRNCHARWCMCCSLLLPWGMIPGFVPESWGELFFEPQDPNIDSGLRHVLSVRRHPEVPATPTPSKEAP
jgi:hypothetical protein